MTLIFSCGPIRSTPRLPIVSILRSRFSRPTGSIRSNLSFPFAAVPRIKAISARTRIGQLPKASLRVPLNERDISYERIEGEAAFYGPKIDIKIEDAIGRIWQLGTIQLDFNLPERFELEYTGEDNLKHRPIMIHRALFGSIERFFGVLIEHYAGAFPLWLAPVQVAVLPITDRINEYAESGRRRAARSRIPCRGEHEI